jgi:hypothetical protein
MFSEGRLVAVVPLVLKSGQNHKGVKVSKLELLGNMASPVRMILLVKTSESDQLSILYELFKFIKNSIRWDVFEMNSLPDEDFPSDMVAKVAGDLGISVKRERHFGNYYLVGPEGGGDGYVSSRKPYIQRNLKTFGKKSNEIGGVRFELFTQGSAAELDAAIDDYYSVLERSWKEWEVHPTFHRGMARWASKKGYLRLGLLYVSDRPIAGQIWLVCDSTAYIVRIAYDQELRKLSPGTRMTCDMMKYVIDVDGVGEIDYLIGDEDYKIDWLPQQRDRLRIELFNPKTPKGWILGVIQTRVIPAAEKHPALRELKERVSKKLGNC